MCGIVGFITNEKSHGKKFRRAWIEQALILDMIRGPHSTGMYMVKHSPKRKEKRPTVLKNNCDAHAFTNMPEFHAYLDTIEDYRAIVGHNRWATRGSKSQGNAHPFQEGNITAVHNGTLQCHTLPTTMSHKDAKEVWVDSQLLTINLNKHGAEETIRKVKGSMALIWHDTRNNVIHAIRNDLRPLFFSMSLEQDTIFFASEAEMLVYLFSVFKHKYGIIHSTVPGELYSFSQKSLKPKVTTMELYKEPKRAAATTYRPGQDTDRNLEQNSFPYHVRGWEEDDTDTPTEFAHSPMAVVRRQEKDRKGKYCDENGAWLDVPIIQKKLVRKHGFDVSQQLPFDPIEYKPEPDIYGKPQFCVIEGRVGISTCFKEAIILGLGVVSIRHKLEKRARWTVQPIGVRYEARVNDDNLPTDVINVPIILCRLVATFMTEDANSWTSKKLERMNKKRVKDSDKILRESQKKKIENTNENDYSGDFICGPGDDMISVEEYMWLVSKGCFGCAHPIDIAEAEHIFWLTYGESETFLPCCEGCGHGIIARHDGEQCEELPNILEMVEH